MTNCCDRLANKIEVHLSLDESPGYYLTKDDQHIIIESLRFASRYNVEPTARDDLLAYAKGLHDADQMIGALWSDLFNKDLVTSAGSDYFDRWRGRIRALAVSNGDQGSAAE